MLSRWFQFTVLFMICISFGCGDEKPTRPVPEESFELRIAVVDSTGAPVEGLLVSTWTDTVVLNPESSSAAATFQMDDTHLYGDVDCDGGAFTSWDTDNMMYYMARMPSTLTDEQLDCIEKFGDVVPASNGITVADFEYVFLRFNYPGIPDGRTLRYGEVDYLYDESTGVISFPYPFEVWALLLTYEKSGFGWPHVYRGETRDIDITYGYDSSYYYALVWSNSGFGGDVVQGYGTLHSIDAAGRYGQPLRLTRVAHQLGIGGWDSDITDSVYLYRLFPFFPPVMRPIEIEVHDLENRLVDDTVLSNWPASSITWRPDSLFSTVYRFEMELVEAEDLVVRDTSFGVFWTDDPERTVVGQTDSSGGVIVSDIRLFPGLFDLPMLWVADTTYPFQSTQFVFSDSVTIHMRDTSTGEFKEQKFLLTDGPNEVKVVWP